MRYNYSGAIKKRRRQSAGRRAASRRNRQAPESTLSFNNVLVIVVVALICAFVTTKYIVYPVMECEFPTCAELWDRYKPSVADLRSDDAKDASQTTNEDSTGEDGDKETVDSDQEANSDTDGDTDAEYSYAIQFGSFTTKEAAESMVDELSDSGINAVVQKSGEYYKVIGPIFDQKAQAVAAMKDIDDPPEGTFVTKLTDKSKD